MDSNLAFLLLPVIFIIPSCLLLQGCSELQMCVPLNTWICVSQVFGSARFLDLQIALLDIPKIAFQSRTSLLFRREMTVIWSSTPSLGLVAVTTVSFANVLFLWSLFIWSVYCWLSPTSVGVLFAHVFSPLILPVGEVLGMRAEVFSTKHAVYHKDGPEASTFPVWSVRVLNIFCKIPLLVICIINIFSSISVIIILLCLWFQFLY